jgi:hypothetical protein
MDALDQLALMLASALRTCPVDVSLVEQPWKPPTVSLRSRGSRDGRLSRGQGIARALSQAAVDPLGQRR